MRRNSSGRRAGLRRRLYLGELLRKRGRTSGRGQSETGPYERIRTQRRGTAWVSWVLGGGSTRLNMNGFVRSGLSGDRGGWGALGLLVAAGSRLRTPG